MSNGEPKYEPCKPEEADRATLSFPMPAMAEACYSRQRAKVEKLGLTIVQSGKEVIIANGMKQVRSSIEGVFANLDGLIFEKAV